MRSEPFDVARAACFEQLAGVSGSSVGLYYAMIRCHRQWSQWNVDFVDVERRKQSFWLKNSTCRQYNPCFLDVIIVRLLSELFPSSNRLFPWSLYRVLSGFNFVRYLLYSLLQVPLKFPGHFYVWIWVADFPLFSCDFWVREHRRYFLKAKRTRFQHHPIQQTHPPWTKNHRKGCIPITFFATF